jgi:ParB family chromosome partitioning protein
MTERRRGLGRGLGALIPAAPPAGTSRPSDVFFPRSTELTVDEERGRVADRFTGNGASEHSEPPPGDRGESGGAADAVESASVDAETRENGQEPDGARAEGLSPVPGAEFAEIPVERIRANPRQPRQVFDEDELAELEQSIREIGVLQPVVVRRVSPTDEGAEAEFELVMGERRLRASRMAGAETIPAIVRDTGDEVLLRDALLENLHRSQLNPLEEAAAYQQLLEDFGCTQEELAGRIGRSRPQISNTIRLLKLPPLVQRRVASGVLSAGHARALLGLPDGAAMERLAQRIVAEGLSVRSVEEIVLLGDKEEPTRRSSSRQEATPRPELEEAAARLADRLDTRVSIAMGRRKGKVTVEFASVEDLDRILGLLESATD